MDLFQREHNIKKMKAKIKVAGVGGGGGNALNHMISRGIEGVEFIAVNTDAQDLVKNSAPYMVQIGEQLTKGLGVGGNPSRGRKAAEESTEDLKHLISGTDLLFVTAGMGGGTGTGAAPVLAKLAKEMMGDKILVIAVVTRPFEFEGYVRSQNAEEGIAEIQKYADSTIIIPNEKLFEIIDSKTSTKEAFSMVDKILLQAVRGISDVITYPGQVNIDFRDVETIMRNCGKSLIGIGEAEGDNRHIEAIKQAITSPLLENTDIQGARGFLVHFLSGDDITLKEQGEVMNIVKQNANNKTEIIYGFSTDENLGNKMKITIVAAGFDANTAAGMMKRKAITSKMNSSNGAGDSGLGNDMSSLFATKKEMKDTEKMLIPTFLRNKKD
ncbi:MAG: cell division protein FtsZ [Elusimicrobiaceae bacterium]|nr:cell division protein FtsZ [Elusimicrobiaceae bacterium]MBT3954605.1 cell division protein FtsZ [Elusimicrobiaceae bacterium]MBT4007913.1 cell division protein FtsZ [Elusimicrobiaceae bacterium]MBT4403161.1 cell division protein FtsZ [Elusimicrobiaceae bacterium]MBT4439927.1 cell division protein FtsZ [Elusimicrobiaceae bacterium]